MFAYKAHIETTLTHTDYKLLCDQKDQIITSLQLQVQSLQLQLAELKKVIFGSKGEKFIASANINVVQPDMFPDDKLAEQAVAKTILIKSFEKKQTTLVVKHPGRNPLPESLRREVIELLPEEDVSELKPVGTEVSERLEYQPGELFVKQFVRPEYIKPSADGLTAKRVIAPLPAMCPWKNP